MHSKPLLFACHPLIISWAVNSSRISNVFTLQWLNMVIGHFRFWVFWHVAEHQQILLYAWPVHVRVSDASIVSQSCRRLSANKEGRILQADSQSLTLVKYVKFVVSVSTPFCTSILQIL